MLKGSPEDFDLRATADEAREAGLDILLLVPTVPLGILLGEWVHHRIDERRFRMAVLALLIAAAISLIVRYP